MTLFEFPIQVERWKFFKLIPRMSKKKYISFLQKMDAPAVPESHENNNDEAQEILTSNMP